MSELEGFTNLMEVSFKNCMSNNAYEHGKKMAYKFLWQKSIFALFLYKHGSHIAVFEMLEIVEKTLDCFDQLRTDYPDNEYAKGFYEALYISYNLIKTITEKELIPWE